MKITILIIPVIFFLIANINLYGQPGTIELMNAINKINSRFEDLNHRFDVLEKEDR